MHTTINKVGSLMQRIKFFISFIAITFFIMGCTGIPKGVKPIDNFKPKEYMGKWYEIARLDHSFERGMDQVTAEYSINADGTIKVVNRGYQVKKQKWEQADGKAKFASAPNVGYLEVSFFGPFYGSYIIIDSDDNHKKYSLVSGPNRSYLWILSRTPQLDTETTQRLVKEAKDLGYPTDDLIFVKQTAQTQPSSSLNTTSSDTTSATTTE